MKKQLPRRTPNGPITNNEVIDILRSEGVPVRIAARDGSVTTPVFLDLPQYSEPHQPALGILMDGVPISRWWLSPAVEYGIVVLPFQWGVDPRKMRKPRRTIHFMARKLCNQLRSGRIPDRPSR